MLEAVFAQVRGLARTWHTEAERRRQVTRVEPVADTLDYNAGELEQLLSKLEEDTAMLTPGEFAKLHKTTPQTVSAWCRAGKLTGAVPKGRSWLIPRTSAAPRRRTARRGARA